MPSRLCLVGKFWNDIANATSDLWTKVTLAYPLHASQLSAAKKWLRTSEPKAIDVRINLCDPAWNNFSENASHSFWNPAELQDMDAVLRGSEHRWRSISIKSDILRPIHEFLRLYDIPSLPSLESISFDRCGEVFPEDYLLCDTWRFYRLPILFGGIGTIPMPKIREVSLSVAHVNWTSAAVSFQNLRKLEIKTQPYGVGPSFEQFAALLAASPRLETLDVTRYSPNQSTLSTQTRIPLVHLPALKRFVLKWADIDFTRYFLTMFQIPESLETLSLVDTEAGLGTYRGEDRRMFNYSSRILQRLADLGLEDPSNKNPSYPWISTLGLKSVSLGWVKSDPHAVFAFLENVPMIEEIRLTDVSIGVLKGIAALAKTQHLQSLKRLYIRRIWNNGDEPEEARLVTHLLQNHGFQVIVEKVTEQGRRLTPIAVEALLSKENAE
jgi:hypothetical protein